MSGSNGTSHLPSCSAVEVHELQKLLSSGSRLSTYTSECLPLKEDFSLAPLLDKVGAKRLVKEWEPSLHHAKLYAVVYQSDHITPGLLAKLPPEFIFKASQGSTMTIVVKEQGYAASCHGFCSSNGQMSRQPKRWRAPQLDQAAGSGIQARHESLAQFLRTHCAIWLGIDYGARFSLRGYSNIRRACFFEEKFDIGDGSVPSDLRVFTTHFRPKLILFTSKCINDRAEGGGSAAEATYYFTPAGTFLPGSADHRCSARPIDRKPEILQQCALIRVGKSPRLPLTNATLSRAMAMASRLASHSGRTQIRIDFFILSPTDVAFAEFSPTTSGCYWIMQPITLHVLMGFAYSRTDDPLSDACMAGVVRRAACKSNVSQARCLVRDLSRTAQYQKVQLGQEWGMSKEWAGVEARQPCLL
eukprot:scaffold130815_cov29-Tisochrysis_lutea.AAC.1